MERSSAQAMERRLGNGENVFEALKEAYKNDLANRGEEGEVEKKKTQERAIDIFLSILSRHTAHKQVRKKKGLYSWQHK